MYKLHVPDRVELPDYYAPDNSHDYICSQPDDDGMNKCSDLAPLVLNSGRVCNGSGKFTNESESGGNRSDFVDWSQYYTVCRAGPDNPFHGAISFDNIGHACVAIFQVELRSCTSNVALIKR